MAIEEDTSYLPTDIIQMILSKLPVKSLLRFKTVSKSWNTMISSPEFTQIHFQQSKNSYSKNLFLRKHSSTSSQGFSLVKLEGRRIQTEALLGRPYGWKISNCAVLCFCDGVVLLSDFPHKKYALWNPSIRMKTMLWFPYRFYSYPMNYGLCHDPTIDDFKVVITSGKYYTVFSCKNKSWTKRQEFPYTSRTTINTGLFVDGAIYWVLADRRQSTYTKEIVYFDPRDDEFRTLQKPKHVKGSDEFFLICLGGCLGLYCSTTKKMMVEIWIKEKGRDKNSWTELMTIENVKMPLELFKPSCFLENKILVRLSDERHVVYSPFEKMFEEFEETEVFGLRLMVPCADTLFFPIQNTRPKRKRSHAHISQLN